MSWPNQPINLPSARLYSAPARALSLVLASMMAVLVTVYPPALAHMGHGLLSLMVWGMSAGFVHGLGFDPDGRFWRVVFSPLSAWLLMGWGLGVGGDCDWMTYPVWQHGYYLAEELLCPKMSFGVFFGKDRRYIASATAVALRV